jgi:hypothetical protein
MKINEGLFDLILPWECFLISMIIIEISQWWKISIYWSSVHQIKFWKFSVFVLCFSFAFKCLEKCYQDLLLFQRFFVWKFEKLSMVCEIIVELSFSCMFYFLFNSVNDTFYLLISSYNLRTIHCDDLSEIRISV